MKYINVKAIKGRAKDFDRRVGEDFLKRLDDFVGQKIESACQTRNGGKITIDNGVADMVLGRGRR